MRAAGGGNIEKASCTQNATRLHYGCRPALFMRANPFVIHRDEGARHGRHRACTHWERPRPYLARQRSLEGKPDICQVAASSWSPDPKSFCMQGAAASVTTGSCKGQVNSDGGQPDFFCCCWFCANSLSCVPIRLKGRRLHGLDTATLFVVVQQIISPVLAVPIHRPTDVFNS